MKYQIGTKPEANTLIYTTTDGKKIDIDKDIFDAKIISHSYKNEGIIVFDKPITKIPGYAFSMCNTLQRITIPESVKTFYVSSFNGCINLEEFNHSCASSDKRCLISKGVLKVFAPAKLTEYIIPDGVTTIGKSAFRGTKLKKIVITEGVQVIDSCAFQFCKNLCEVVMPSSISVIGQSAFSNCHKLENITIPSNITKVDDWAFVGCKSLKNFYGTLASSDNRCLILGGRLVAFASAGITNYVFPSEIVSYSESVFDYNPKIKSLKKELKKTLELRRSKPETIINGKEQELNPNIGTDIVAITKCGYIKRTSKFEFKINQTGSEGVLKGFYTDGIKTLKEVALEDILLLFTENGKCFNIKVSDIPDTRILDKGLSLKEKFGLVGDDFCAILPIKSFDDDSEVLIMTKYWRIVRQNLIAYKGKKQGIKVVELNPDDHIASVILAKKEEYLFNCNIYGFGKLFHLQDIPRLCLKAKGVVCSSNGYFNRSVSKNNIESFAALSCLDICNSSKGSHIIVTTQGYLSRVDSAPVLGRATSGPRLLNLRENDTVIYNSYATDDESVLIVTAKGYTLNLNISNLKICKHGNKGSLCIKMADNDYVVACCKMSPLKEITINSDKYIAYKQETEESQNLLSNIFDEVEENIVEYNNTSDVVLEVLEILFAKEIWSKEEVENICKSKGLITGAILEEINDYSYSMVDDAVVEDNGDTIYVMLNYKEELL